MESVKRPRSRSRTWPEPSYAARSLISIRISTQGHARGASASSFGVDYLLGLLDVSLNGIYVYDLDRGVNVYVNRRYTELTGRMELPPKWAIGYHQCRYSYYPDSRVREIADTFRQKQ